jgi:hypothetical protein
VNIRILDRDDLGATAARLRPPVMQASLHTEVETPRGVDPMRLGRVSVRSLVILIGVG